MGSVTSLVAVEPVHRGPYVKSIPDVILPSQFFELVGTRRFSSEQRLMLAVLADAINVLGEYRASPDRDRRRSFNEASSWAEIVRHRVEGAVSVCTQSAKSLGACKPLSQKDRSVSKASRSAQFCALDHSRGSC